MDFEERSNNLKSGMEIPGLTILGKPYPSAQEPDLGGI